MIYALLWIEVLVASLLWVAACAAYISHFNAGWVRRWMTALAIAIPFVLLTLCAGLTGYLKFQAELRTNWFVYTVSLWALFLIGTVIVLIAASRRSQPGLGPAARLWPRGRLGMAALAALAIAGLTLWSGDMNICAQAAVTEDEASAIFTSVSPPLVADAENAAVLYERAFASLDADPLVQSRDFEPKPDDPQYVALARRQAGALRLLRRGAAMANCRLDHDWARPDIHVMLPSLNDVRTAGNVLQLDARIALAHGDTAAAIADVNAIGGMARHVGQEPILVSALLSFGMEHLAVDTLQDVLDHGPSRAEIGAIDAVDPTAARRSLLRALHGEECFGMTTYAELQTGETTPDEVTGIGNRMGEETEGAINLFNVIEPLSTLRRVYVFSIGLESYEQLMDRYKRLALRPYCQSIADLDEIQNQSFELRHLGFFQLVFTPTLSATFRNCAEVEAADVTAQAALAAARYRVDHGALPSQLADLVPDYLSGVPEDPFDGKSLRLVTKNGQWIVYSIGADGKDDGGTPEVDDRRTHAKSGEITFSLPLQIPATQP